MEKLIHQEGSTWPLWMCIPQKSLVKLILYQWDNFKMKLEILTYAFDEVEDLDEIDRLVRQRPRYRRDYWNENYQHDAWASN